VSRTSSSSPSRGNSSSCTFLRPEILSSIGNSCLDVRYVNIHTGGLSTLWRYANDGKRLVRLLSLRQCFPVSTLWRLMWIYSPLSASSVRSCDSQRAFVEGGSRRVCVGGWTTGYMFHSVCARGTTGELSAEVWGCDGGGCVASCSRSPDSCSCAHVGLVGELCIMGLGLLRRQCCVKWVVALTVVMYGQLAYTRSEGPVTRNINVRRHVLD
jgi:hypothetical protein